MRKRRALVFADARSEEVTASTERFVVLGGAISVIVSPVAQGGRFLGILELLNPTDGVPFSEDEGNAIDYMSDQFGEFVASRGTQLDPDRIARSVPPAGLP
jgi:GAF domain-containing protein